MPKSLASRVCPQLSPGRRHELPENHEPTLTTQRLAHGQLFRTEQRLIEATDGEVGLAGAEQEATARQPEYPVERDGDGSQSASVARQGPVEAKRAATADRTSTHGRDRRSHSGLGDDRVGVDEYEHLTIRFSRPRVACRGDLAAFHRDHPRPMLLRDRGGPVGRRVIHYDDFDWLAQCLRRVVDRAQRAAEEPLLVVRRDDE